MNLAVALVCATLACEAASRFATAVARNTNFSPCAIGWSTRPIAQFGPAHPAPIENRAKNLSRAAVKKPRPGEVGCPLRRRSASDQETRDRAERGSVVRGSARASVVAVRTPRLDPSRGAEETRVPAESAARRRGCGLFRRMRLSARRRRGRCRRPLVHNGSGGRRRSGLSHSLGHAHGLRWRAHQRVGPEDRTRSHGRRGRIRTLNWNSSSFRKGRESGSRKVPCENLARLRSTAFGRGDRDIPRLWERGALRVGKDSDWRVVSSDRTTR